MRKKIVSLILVICMVVSVIPQMAFADDVTNENTDDTSSNITADSEWEYALYKDGVELTKYLGDDTDVYVPGTIETEDSTEYDVIKLGDSVFANNESINSATLGEGILEIGTEAFSNATNLVCILTSEELTTIDEKAFYGCTNFNSIILYDAVETIGTDAFSGCTNLTIWCNEGNVGYNYAINNNIKYELLSSQTTPDTYVIDGVTYYVMNGEAIAVDFDESTTTATIASTIEGYPVTELRQTFRACDLLTSVTLPNTIKTIGEYAFYSCPRLTSMVLPDSVTYIDDYAFSVCHRMTEINIPYGVTYIGAYAFWSCQELVKIDIPNSVTTMGYDAFLGCYNLKEVTLSNNLTKINTACFWGCSSLTEISIPEGVTYISGSAFNSCTNLQSVTIPETVDTIQRNAFEGCRTLEKLIIPKSVTTLSVDSFEVSTVLVVYEDSYAHTFAEENNFLYVVGDVNTELQFYQVDGIVYFIINEEAIAIRCTDTSLTTATISAEVEGHPVTELRGTFKNCTALTSVVIPNSVEIIGEQAFYGCSSLSEINIPNSVTNIGDSAFYNCNALVNVIIPEGVTYIDDYAFYSCSNLVQIDVPDTVSCFGNHVFDRCVNLIEITLPNGISVITSNLFSNCSGLTEITIPSNITSISSSAFANCSNLTNVTIPESVTTIASKAFNSCEKLEYVYIPKKLTTMSADSFSKQTILIVYENSYAHTYAIENDLLYITWDGVTEPQILELDDIMYCVIDGKAIAIKYKNETVTSVTIPTEIEGYPVTELRYTFMNTSVSEVSLPNCLEIIGNYAFYETNIVTLTIPTTVTTIGEYTFYNSALKTIEIPNSVTTIGRDAFHGTNLEIIDIPNSVTFIGAAAFQSCRNLTKITLPDNITSLSDFLFYFCTDLVEIVIPDTVTSIGFDAFKNCVSLENIIIPDSVTTIANQAFYDCTSLDMVLVPDTVTSMLKDSFPSNTILLVYQDSYAHTFAVENELLYFVVGKTDNPEIAYGTGLSGTVTYSNDTIASGVTVELLSDDGIVKETVQTDENGAYEFTYAEVGKYTIHVTDGAGYTATETVSVKRMNVFEVFLAGDTNLTLKKGWNVTGTVSEKTATITLIDQNGNILATVETEDGTFTITEVPNGTYILKAESDNGSITQEITVFDDDVTDVTLTINTDVATIWGYVEVEDRKSKHHRRNWVQVTVYNEDGNVVAQCKSDKDGKYEFKNLPVGEYTIVAETAEMRPDKKHRYDRSHTLTGYVFVDAAEKGTYQADTIVLYEENDYVTTISGKVTANGEGNVCEVVLRNVFRYEVARQTTGSNGKYSFKNVRDGLYIITATTESDGMGFTVVVVRNGRVYGETDIKVLKSDKVKNHEDAFFNDVPDWESRDESAEYRERIAKEKRFYDGLSEKEKKQCSKEYVARLNKYVEWLANCNCTASEGVAVEQAGLVVSGDELENKENITFNLNVEKKTKHELSGDGVNNSDDYIQHSMEDAAQKQHDYEITEYYEISMTKQVGDEEEQAITSVYKDTDAMGKFRVTITIPDEYKGYKNYSFVHVHNGEVVTLVDLDDNPDTVTFEVDAFSTFALLATNVEQTGESIIGDLNGDDIFDELDVVMMRAYLIKKESCDVSTSDINSDSTVDIRDIIALKRGIKEGTLEEEDTGSEGGEVDGSGDW